MATPLLPPLPAHRQMDEKAPSPRFAAELQRIAIHSYTNGRAPLGVCNTEGPELTCCCLTSVISRIRSLNFQTLKRRSVPTCWWIHSRLNRKERRAQLQPRLPPATFGTSSNMQQCPPAHQYLHRFSAAPATLAAAATSRLAAAVPPMRR